jgi:hypothetical protein
VEELQEQLLMWEEELTQREGFLAAWEKATISEKALVKVSADLDVERAKTKATRQEYHSKMCMHTTHTKHTLNFDKMLSDKKVQLHKTERQLAQREVALMEAQARGLNS